MSLINLQDVINDYVVWALSNAKHKVTQQHSSGTCTELCDIYTLIMLHYVITLCGDRVCNVINMLHYFPPDLGVGETLSVVVCGRAYKSTPMYNTVPSINCILQSIGSHLRSHFKVLVHCDML